MITLEEQLSGKLHAGQASNIAREIIESRGEISLLTSLTKSQNLTLAWRAAWVIDIISKSGSRVLTSASEEIKETFLTSTNPGVCRHLANVLSELPVSLVEDGRVFDKCLRLIIDRRSPVAVKANAITLAANFCEIYPELGDELLGVMESLVHANSPGLEVRCRKTKDRLTRRR